MCAMGMGLLRKITRYFNVHRIFVRSCIAICDYKQFAQGWN